MYTSLRIDSDHIILWASSRENLSGVSDKVRFKPVSSAIETS